MAGLTSEILPEDGTAGTLIGRLWRKGSPGGPNGGPSVVAVRADLFGCEEGDCQPTERCGFRSMSSDLPDARSPDDHVVFSTTIDVLFRKTLAPTITRDIEARLLKVGIDLSRPLEPGYPLRVFDDALEVVVTNGMPHLSKAEGLQRIGRLQVEAFLETLIGKATFAYLRLISRERFVNRLTQSWRQANNFIDTVVTARADG